MAFIERDFPHWNQDLITTGFYFDMNALAGTEGFVNSADLKGLASDDWIKSGKAQFGEISVFVLRSEPSLTGEYLAFRLAARSFCRKVCLVQSSFKEEQFLGIVKRYWMGKRRKDEDNLLSDILPEVI